MPVPHTAVSHPNTALPRLRAAVRHRAAAGLLGLAGLVAGLAGPAAAQVLAPTFAADYSVVSLGSAPGVPPSYGGLTFLDADTLLLGGAANGSGGRLYTVDVVRDANLHITGFTGTASLYMGGGIGAYNDGGVAFGPGGVLFTTRYPTNQLGQAKPGSLVEDRIIDLTPLGVGSSVGAVNFVPVGFGFGGEGQIKLASYNTGGWYSATLTPDGNGTYDLTGLAAVDLDTSLPGVQGLVGGPEGFVYVRSGNAQFSSNSLLVSEYGNGVVSAYQVDANGNPLLATRRVFISGLSGAEGAVIDPYSGDFLFSTFGGGNQVVVVSGFANPVPEPASVLLMLTGGLALLWRARPALKQPPPAAANA